MSRERFLGSELPRFEALLAKEGCPICHSIAGSDDRFFFWFFAEQYYSSYMLDLLPRSLGFCAAHAARIVSKRTGGHQIVGCCQVVVGRIRRRIAEEQFAPTDVCPPCKDLHEMAQREVWFLTSLLNEEADFVSRYGHPGTLCFPHLCAAVYRVSAPMAERLLSIGETALLSAASAVKQLRTEGGKPGGGPAESGRMTFLPLLHLALGHDRGDWLFPSIHEDDGEPGPRDPVADLLETIRRPDVCCACLAMRRAWIEWGKWLDMNADKRFLIEDRLPTCSAHAWALAHQGGPLLARLIGEAAVQSALGRVVAAARCLTASEKPDRAWSLRTIARKMRGQALRLRLAREALALEPTCPVCTRLRSAADRTLTLLFALLEVGPHRDAYQTGYALCLHHFCRALALGPSPQTRGVLVETEAAKLALLHWELEEFIRKSGWDSRPEARHTEGATPWKAVLRFSGSLGRETGMNGGASLLWDKNRDSALLRDGPGH